MPDDSRHESRIERAAELAQSRMTRATLLRRAALGVGTPALLSLLAACGGSGSSSTGPTDPNEKVELKWWKFEDPSDTVFKKAVKEWNAKNPKTQVKLETFPFGQYADTTLTTAFASGGGPDVFWVSQAIFINYVNQGLAAPLDDLIAPIRGDYLPAPLTANTADGHLRALPFEMEPVALYYNTDMLDKAGVKPPTNWQELVDTSKELKRDGHYGIVIEPAPGAYQVVTWLPFLWMAGGEVTDAEWTKCLLRTDEAASAFQLWGDIMTSGAAPKKSPPTQTADIGQFGRGETAMHLCGYWAKGYLESDYPKINYGVVQLPPPTAAAKPVGLYGGWMQMVNARGKHVDRAKEFTNWLWLQNTDVPHDWACVTNTKFSPRKEVNAECWPKVLHTPVDQYFEKQVLPAARAEPHYPDQVYKGIQNGIQAAMFGGKDGHAAANLAADTIDGFLKSYKGFK